MAGLGTTALGFTPFGVGTPDEAVAPPTSLPTASRFLNWRTKDYEVAADGELKRMPTVRHRVLVILSTTLGSSSALPELGLRLPDRIDKTYPQLADKAVRLALKRMVDARELKVQAVTVARSQVTGRVDHIVAFMDLTTGNAETVTI